MSGSAFGEGVNCHQHPDDSWFRLHALGSIPPGFVNWCPTNWFSGKVKTLALAPVFIVWQITRSGRLHDIP